MNIWTTSSDCSKEQKVVDESNHGANFAVKWVDSCETCLENGKNLCKCQNSNELQFEVKNETKETDVVHPEANSSFLSSVMNMIGMLIGLGQLSTPYAIENGGWISSFLLIALGIATAYTSHLLGKCLQNNRKARNYPDIGYHAFGTHGRAITATFIYIEIFMALVSYTISLHDNLNMVFLGTHVQFSWAHHLSTSQVLTVFAVLVALPSLWLRDLSSISFLSTGGIIMSAMIFVTVMCTALFGGVSANHAIPALRLGNIPHVSGLYIFSYGGHIVFPDIHRAMKDPSKFTKVSIVSFTCVTLLYTSSGFMGAKLFGPEVNSQITLSMPRGLIFTKIALWATVLTPMTKYALEFAPLAIQLEHRFLYSMTSRTKMIIRGTIGSVLLLLILVLALTVPFFEYVLGLTGSLVTVAIVLIFPSVFYLKIFWNQISTPVVALNVFLIAIGFLLGVSGTISSMKLLVEQFERIHSAS
ncbi:transmembrane amino acid transporter family protein [Artemisia annua]|uniref:Transmembrane amino acid transporter family protein n=1 Tax=Artemisia annua TaxID=35608 RepID=A0A2U1M018_ARTAN|nr:transmembrane amino acid transporter family protein [Artemisia annua]